MRLASTDQTKAERKPRRASRPPSPPESVVCPDSPAPEMFAEPKPGGAWESNGRERCCVVGCTVCCVLSAYCVRNDADGQLRMALNDGSPRRRGAPAGLAAAGVESSSIVRRPTAGAVRGLTARWALGRSIRAVRRPAAVHGNLPARAAVAGAPPHAGSSAGDGRRRRRAGPRVAGGLRRRMTPPSPRPGPEVTGAAGKPGGRGILSASESD